MNRLKKKQNVLLDEENQKKNNVVINTDGKIENINDFKFKTSKAVNQDVAVIIDGNGLLRTLFYATYKTWLDGQTNDDHYSRELILYWIQRNVFEEYSPEYFVFALDNKYNLRKNMFPEYKAQRGRKKVVKEGMTQSEITKIENYNAALALEKEHWEAFFEKASADVRSIFNVQSYYGYEGDDVLKTYADYFKSLDIRVILYSDDRDITQLLTHDTIAMRTFRRYSVEIIDDSGKIIKDKDAKAPLIFSQNKYYNLLRGGHSHLNGEITMPEDIVLSKILAGDSSDNIPSVKFFEDVIVEDEQIISREKNDADEIIETKMISKETVRNHAKTGIGGKAAIKLIHEFDLTNLNDLIIKMNSDVIPDKYLKHLLPNISNMIIKEKIITLMSIPNFEMDLTLFATDEIVEVVTVEDIIQENNKVIDNHAFAKAILGNL